MAIYGYTKNYKLIKPQFNTDTWHDYIYDNLDTIDAVMSAIYASGNWKGFWATNTVYAAGDVIIDQATDTMYKVMVDHTTSESTFAAEQTAHPDYYELWSPNNLAESWAIKTDGKVSNTDYSAKAYAISSGLINDGSAKEWAIGSGAIGNTNEYSAKKYATDAHNDYISMTTNVNVIAVGSNIANVNAVGQCISNVNTVASNVSSVNTVAGVSTDVTTVAGIASSVPTVANNSANVTTVANDISSVNVAATNIEFIKAAENNANDAKNSKIEAQNSAVTAQLMATQAQDWATKTDGKVDGTEYSSKYYAGQASDSANNSHIWAEGTDAQVQALGGVHSSKVWAEQSTNANISLTNSPYTTNRILEIPQDIKLELNNGTLTLKAGSKVYVPNGFEADGTTPHFDIITTTNDLSTTPTVGKSTNFIRYENGKILADWSVSAFSSGADSTGHTGWFYNTTTNTIRYYRSGTPDSVNRSFPIGISINSGSNITTSIDQVFNGFGYIGSTIFVLPGIKCLVGNGRNPDGSCITKIEKSTSVSIFTSTQNRQNNKVILRNGKINVRSSAWFDEQANMYFNNIDSSYDAFVVLGTFSTSTSSPWNITEFKPLGVDSLANSNASNFSQAGRSYLSGLGMPSNRYIDLTILASRSIYTVPANGYFIAKGTGNATQGGDMIIRRRVSDVDVYGISAYLPNGYGGYLILPVKAGDTVDVYYNRVTMSSIRFYYAEGEN